MTPLCPLPVKPPEEEKPPPENNSQPPITNNGQTITTQAGTNIPPAPQIKKIKIGLNILYSIVTAAIITALIATILYFINIDFGSPLIVVILVLAFLASFILFFALRYKK